MKNIFFYFFIFIVLTASLSCNREKEVTLNIIQTTDIHGALFPYDFTENKSVNNSLANVATVVKKIRQENPENTILLDNGDFFQGSPDIYYYNYEDTLSKHLGVEMLNYLNYDAITVGNHDVECGHDIYDKVNKQLKAPWLAANAVDKKTGKPYFKPYTIIHRGNIRIAVLGLITPTIPNWLPEYLWEGIVFEDMIEAAKKWIPIIQKKEKPDLMIGMFHSGVDFTYGNQNRETYKNENASQLVAEQVPGFDIILAGHDHQRYNKKIVNVDGDTVFLVDPQSHGRAVASIVVKLNYNKVTKKWDKSIVSDIINVENYSADEDFMRTFSKQYQEIEKYVSRKIGEFKTSISTQPAYFGNSAFIDFIQKIQLENSKAQISFSAPLYFNTTLQKGNIYVRDMFKLYKYENMLYTISLTGREINNFLEYSAGLWFNQMTNKNAHLLLLKEKNGQIHLLNSYYNLSSASGIDYVIDVSKPVGKRVTISQFSDGNTFYNDSTYTVALSSYRANGGGGHLTNGAGILQEQLKDRVLDVSKHDLRFIIKQYIKKEKILDLKPNNNWQIIPKEYYEEGKKKDIDLLFTKFH